MEIKYRRSAGEEVTEVMAEKVIITVNGENYRITPNENGDGLRLSKLSFKGMVFIPKNQNTVLIK